MAKCTKEESLETRHRILDAAEEVFSAQGVANTSLAEIAEAARVTRGAIYWHFKNKSDLFNAMWERVRLPIETMVDAIASEGEADPLGQLRNRCIAVLTEAEHNPHSRKVFDILLHKCEFVDPEDPIYVRRREWFLKGLSTIEQILRNAIAKGQLPKDLDTKVACAAFLGNIDGLLNTWLFAPDSFELAVNAERFIDASIDMLRHARSLRRTDGGGT